MKVTFRTSENGTETGTITYRYDVYDQRISVVGTGSVAIDQREIRDGGNLVAITDSAGAVTSRFFTSTALNDVVAEESGATVKWALTDQQGSVRDIVNSSGTVIDHIVYDSYGNTLSQTNPTNAMAVGYTSQQ